MPTPDPAPTIGLLYPGLGAEDDFPALESRLDGAIRLALVHTSVGEDAHRVDALLDLGSSDRLAAGARSLAAHHPDAVMWACTSGSFVFGWEGAQQQVDEIQRVLDIPASSTSIAFVQAARALDVTAVAVAASYPDEVAQHFVQFLERGGVTTVGFDSSGIVTAAEVGTLGADAVRAMVCAVDVDGAQAVLVPDTAMHSLAWVEGLEQAVGKPVLTANQVTVWEGLRIAGAPTRL
ncbi:MAG: maleate cis-trans isomerase family protein, partial [Nocardioidaceae bacterium]